MTPLDLCLSGALVLALLWGLSRSWALEAMAKDRDECLQMAKTAAEKAAEDAARRAL